MTYKPVRAQSNLRKQVISDPETRAIYEATRLQIELSLALKMTRKKRKMNKDDVADIMKTKK